MHIGTLIALIIFIVAAIVFVFGFVWLSIGADRRKIGESKFGVYLLLLSLGLAIAGGIVAWVT